MQPCDGGCSAPRPAALRKDSTHDAVRHGCCLGCRVRMLHVFLLFPFDDVGSAIPPLQLRPVFGVASSRVPSGNAMSCSIGFGDKSWDNFKNFFRIEFLFLSQRAQRTIFGGSIAPKTPVLKLKRPFVC